MPGSDGGARGSRLDGLLSKIARNGTPCVDGFISSSFSAALEVIISKTSLLARLMTAVNLSKEPTSNNKIASFSKRTVKVSNKRLGPVGRVCESC